ncbi:MAG: polysaccharide deacetylase family protein [Clostridiales bacterium]|jgi:peptidoglycan/xylan/chitin deacetylase (PgdA/CDA1 family)|nr:polysaccharide deacetylase family protein [Clostridiales bacterium]
MIIKPRAAWTAMALLLVLFVAAVQFSCRVLSVSADAPAEPETVCVPIMVYHEVKPKLSSYVISPYEFESDLKFLKENHYTAITMTELIDFVCRDKGIPEKPIILSFDDGYLDNYKYVYPLLKKYNQKIVLSVIAKNTDDFTQVPDNNLTYSHMTWGQMKEIYDSGLVEIQNHTYNLHSDKNGRIGCKQMRGESDAHYEQVLSEDLMKCQEEIRANIGATPNTFTYPYGESSKNTDGILKKLGFQATLTCKYGVNMVGKGQNTLYGLKRICRMHGVSLKKALEEGMKTLKYQNGNG